MVFALPPAPRNGHSIDEVQLAQAAARGLMTYRLPQEMAGSLRIATGARNG
jgi:hypothetical protein